MELQCKERVDLLEALRKSRLEAEQDAKESADGPSKSKESLISLNKPGTNGEGTPWLGGDTVPQVSYADLPRPSQATPERRPPVPPRPSYVSTKSSGPDITRSKSQQSPTSPKITPAVPAEPRARTPSPEKKSGGMLKTLRSNPKEQKVSGKMATTLRNRPPPAAAKAATQVWAGPPQRPSSTADIRSSSNASGNTTTWDPYTRSLVEKTPEQAPEPGRRISDNALLRPPSPTDYLGSQRSNSLQEGASSTNDYPPPYPEYPVSNPYARHAFSRSEESVEMGKPSPPPPMPPPHKEQPPKSLEKPRPPPPTIAQMEPSKISYMKEFPNHPPAKPKKPPTVPAKRMERTPDIDGPSTLAPPKTMQAKPSPGVPRKAVGRATGVVSATAERRKLDATQSKLNDRVMIDPESTAAESSDPTANKILKQKAEAKPLTEQPVTPPTTDDSNDSDQAAISEEKKEWDKKVKRTMKNLPRGVDEAAAKQIFNEIVIQGDEVHWDDVAGLDIAKSALKETVVYPFLRPDLFMGLREPARGMLLFGPPGTGKTMLARAVATESKSIFFAISASSLTSKYLGESEKLVRALFALAKALVPSIIFVDEIDSLLGSRGGSSEHEATRRIKTEFLIQWSDLQKAAAGREDKEKGDATRVLVLAATNLPWAIDEAARRRFVRRQYIPLPEDWVRQQQLRTLLSAQKHNLGDRELAELVHLTGEFSGSDITALAKDAAMGPLRSLGEKLLHMSPEEIRGIQMEDFRASLVNIRPSVSRQGLKEFEDWAKEFGERGG